MEVGEGTLQYVELGGVVGVFIKLDASHVDEQRVETILKTAQNQIKVMVGAFKDGSNVQRDIYVRASEKKKKSSGCSCKYCDESFYCRLDLVAHQAKQHPQLPARSGRKAAKKCPNCGLLVQNLSLHFKLEHSQLLVYSDGLGFCRQCEQTYPLNTDHASACRFSPRCPDCKKTFSQWRGMIKHRKVVHMGEKIQCPTCKKTFHDSQSLKKHCEAVHMKLKRVCPLCGATVTCLSTHMNAVHADVRNFPCDMCEKKFKSKYDLTRHRDSVHLGNKAACPLCGKHISNLNQHIRIVHKQIKFPCTQCSKKYNTNSELQKHIKQAHPSSLHVDDIQTAARSSPEGLRLPVPESDLEFSQENNYHNNQQILQLTARENQQLQQQSRDNQQVQHQPRDNQQLLLQPRNNKQLSTTYEDESEDMMISQYMNKHPFSINSDEMKQDSVNDQLMASSVKDEQILSKHSLEYLPQSSRQEQRYIELRPMDEGRQLDLRQLPHHNDRLHQHHAHNDRLLHHDDRLHGDRLHHAVIDDRLNPIGPSDDHIHDQVQHRLDQRHVAQDERQQHLELRLQHHPEDRHELEHDSNIHRVVAGGDLRAGDPGVLHPRLQNTYLTTHAGSRNLQDVSAVNRNYNLNLELISQQDPHQQYNQQ